MDDSSATANAAPAQANAGPAPGFEAGQNGGQALPPPPLHIPQNTNPIPTAITSPRSGDQSGMMSPTSAGGFRRAAPEPNKRALYIGGLDQRVTEDVLRQIFETTGHVQNVKIIPDKNVSRTDPLGLTTAILCDSSWLTFDTGQGLQLRLRRVRRPWRSRARHADPQRTPCPPIGNSPCSTPGSVPRLPEAPPKMGTRISLFM